MASDERIIFIDWSDASLSHPFFSLNFFYDTEAEEMKTHFSDTRAACIRLRDVYLEPWTIFEPMDRLREAFELAYKLSSLHFALNYHKLILPKMEVKWEMHYMLPYFLKQLLRSWMGLESWRLEIQD